MHINLHHVLFFLFHVKFTSIMFDEIRERTPQVPIRIKELRNTLKTNEYNKKDT